ncbi:EAL domain-containing protein [Amphibiibacter pelophylacis]|uniref:EAL domain-containing protein n=1 Tax=Amphibiibacter pelophylacis TaxID=1799477 RepID=A0ACC6P136_9BURK
MSSKSRPSAAPAVVQTYPAVIGVGSSAGGLEALTQLISALPPHFPASLVVVQHLSPTHQSMLAQLLGRKTSLLVREIVHQEPLQPGIIYVTPANRNVTVGGDRLLLQEPDAHVVPKPSVNVLFASLAEAYGENAIGVILSGTGSDGTTGMLAIKASGGMTFAQQPDTAKYPGMPTAAIDAGCVSRILPPEDIAREVSQLVLSGEQSVARMAVMPPANLKTLLTLVKRKTRVDFQHYKENTLLRRIERRLAATRCASLEAYLEYIEGHPDELDLLCQDLLISVTSFFRDPDVFEALAHEFATWVGTRPAGEELRIWVPGCATGEEVYTIAILLCEAFGQRLSDIGARIFATDIDQSALEVARRGIYPVSSAKTIPAELLHRYFIRQGDSLQVRKQIRDMVVFARQDVVQDPPFMRLDLVSCRNLLIYFNAELQEKVLKLFHLSLMPGGLLLLGKSESIARQGALFDVAQKKAKLFRKVSRVGDPATPEVGNNLVSSIVRLAQTPRPQSIEAQVGETLNRLYAPPSILVSRSMDVLRLQGDVGRFLTLSSGKASLNLLGMLPRELRLELQRLLRQIESDPDLRRSPPRRVQLQDGSVALVRLAVHVVTKDPMTLLVCLETVAAPDTAPPAEAPAPDASAVVSVVDESTVRRLEDDLAAAQESLQTVVEELETSNEELQAVNEEMQAANEEMQASNEELEASNEELQSSNEELTTVNEELSVKTHELGELNQELGNVLASIDFPVIVLDTQHQLMRWNQIARQMFGLGEVRRIAIEHTSLLSTWPDLMVKLQWAMENAALHESVCTRGERHYIMRITPYVEGAPAGTIRGAVLTLIDQTLVIDTEAKLRLARAQLHEVINSSTNLIAVKDQQGRLLYANRRYLEALNLPTDDQKSLGRTDFELLPMTLARALRDPELDMLESGQAIEREEVLQLPGARGEYLAARYPVRGESDEIFATVTQLTDISGMKSAERSLRSQALMFQNTLDALVDPVVVVSRDGFITHFNEAWTRFVAQLDRSAGTDTIKDRPPQGHGIGDVYQLAAEGPPGQDLLAALARAGAGEVVQQDCAVHMGGQTRWMMVRMSPMHREHGGVVVLHVDMTEQRRLNDRLRLASTVFDNSNDAILVFSGTGEVLMANLPAERLLGYASGALTGKMVMALLEPQFSRQITRRVISSAIKERNWRGELSVLTASGRVLPMWTGISAVMDESGELLHWVALASDISRLKETQTHLSKMAYYDGLTGLPNRRLFGEYLTSAMRRARRNSATMALLFIDLDRFKTINDTLGHHIGDEMLCHLARRICAELRDTDLVARLGGDEFTILLEGVETADDVRHVCQKLLQVLSRPVELDHQVIYTSASIGVALFPEHASDEATLIRRADSAMYNAKSLGRSQFSFYEESLESQSSERLTLETGLRQDAGFADFEVYYQPIIDLQGDQPPRMEALLRWHHRFIGAVEPARFIPVAEDIGLIHSLGKWVLQQACEQFRRSRDGRPGAPGAMAGVSVNLSPVQIRQPGLAEYVESLLETYDIPQGYLTLEITESMLLEDTELVKQTLTRLRRMKVNIALDDFGTGYSSLAQLRLLPINILKIDSSFIQQIDSEQPDQTLVAAIIAMARELGLKVVAEGVETQEQLALLKRLGCDFAQGFLTGRPEPIAQPA